MLDAHFHLNFLPLAHLATLLEVALARGVAGGVVAGVWTEDTAQLASWARNPEGEGLPASLRFLRRGQAFSLPGTRFEVVCAHGLHPETLASRLCLVPAAQRDRALDDAIGLFEAQLVAHADLLFAIGETGYDAHAQTLSRTLPQGLDKDALLALQARALEACVRAAAKAGLPLIVHSRGAWEKTLAGVRGALRAGVPQVMIHCYGGPVQDAVRLAAEGVFLSFGGVPTWARAHRVREAFLACPLENLLLETDAPDLPFERDDGTRPVSHEPAHLADIALRLAKIRGLSPDEIRETTNANLRRFLCMPRLLKNDPGGSG